MTGTDLCVNKCKESRSYLNHLVLQCMGGKNKIFTTISTKPETSVSGKAVKLLAT